MSLLDTIKAEITTAMKAKEKAKLMVLRSLHAAIKQKEIDGQITLDDDAVIAVVQKQIKQRQESLKMYTDNNRDDLAQNEQAEIDVLIPFMPQQLTEAEVTQLVVAEIAAQGATSMKDMGKVMGALRNKIAGKADPAIVSKLIKANLG